MAEGYFLQIWTGKLPTEVLSEIVLDRVNSLRRPSTLIGGEVGEDSALIDLGHCILAVHSDPVTEARFHSGSIAVDVSSNDLAVSGVRPRWFILDILMPGGSLYSSLSSIVESASREAERLGIEIVGGHTESTPGLKSPIIIGTSLGCTCRGCVYPTRNAREGDIIYQINPAAIEGTAIISTDFRDLALDRGVDEKVLERGSEFIKRISVVNEAISISELGLVDAMHDPTEGGIIGGLYEIAFASGHNVEVYLEKIFVEDETIMLSKALGIDYTRLISSGTIIASVPPYNKRNFEDHLESLRLRYDAIGRVLNKNENPTLIILKGGKHIGDISSSPKDEISRLWEERI